MDCVSLELLEQIASTLPSKDKATLCLVNSVFYSATAHLLYRHIIISSPRQYLILKQALQSSILSDLVHRLDFSSYTTRGSRWSEEKAKSIITSTDLADIISGCHNLRDLFVGEEMMHAFVSHKVIKTIFSRQNKLRTIDLTGFCDRSLTTMMADFFRPQVLPKGERLDFENAENKLQLDHWSVPEHLENISFYMCMALSQEHFFMPFFDKLAANGNRLTRLDLAYTRITSRLFQHLANTTTLTHLNLQGCHSLSCCSPLIPFLQNNCVSLVELNINMEFNGIGGSRFCQDCLFKVLASTNTSSLRVLDMGGHNNFDDSVLERLMEHHGQFHVLRHLERFSIAYCRNISLGMLQKFVEGMADLYYLNLARTPFTIDMSCLPLVFKCLDRNIKVIEISPFTPKKYPAALSDWILTSHGRRSYYSRDAVNPKFVYSKKIIMLDDQKLSPMNKYWCYSY